MVRQRMLGLLLLLVAAAIPLAALSGAANAGQGGQNESLPSPDQIQGIARYEFGQSRRALSAVEEQIRQATPAQLRAIEASLLDVLRSPQATYAARKFVCRMLRRMGSCQSVPVLADMLTDAKLSHLARLALQRLPCPEVGDALRQALGELSGDLRIGVIASIGDRGDREAVPELAGLVSSEQRAVSAAAIAALGQIGGSEAARALADAKVPDELSAQWADAYLCCADQMPAEGMPSDALTIYRRLFDQTRITTVRIAALRGMVRAEGQRAVPTVLASLQTDNAELQRAAAKFVAEIPGERATAAFAGALSSLPSGAQVVLLGALAERGDRTAAPEIAGAARSGDEAVRIAAFRALGAVGTSSSVEALAAAAAGGGRAAEAASASLTQLSADGVDPTIVGLLRRADENARRVLIRALAERAYVQGIPTLLEYAQDESAVTRAESLKALARLADQRALPALVSLLVRAEDTERGAAEHAVVAVCRRIEDGERRVEPVLSALADAHVRAQCSLLRVLGALGGQKALEAVRSSAEDTNQEVRDAAVRALAGWPDASPADALMRLARHAPDEIHRVLALRGYVRVTGLLSDRPPEETVAMYRTAVEAADRPEEKKMVLAGVARVPDLSALRFAESYLEERALRAEAQAAYVQVALAISGAHAVEAQKALRTIQTVCDDERLRERAAEGIRAIENRGDYIAGWLISGPYSRDDREAHELLHTTFPPEAAEAKEAKWRLVPALTDPARPWLVDLERLIGGRDRAAYLRTRVHSPRMQRVRLELGSDDGVKVWLNGEVVHQNNVFRPTTPGEDKVAVVLKEGWNTLLLKITQGGGQWSACARFRALDGARLEGLKIRASP